LKVSDEGDSSVDLGSLDHKTSTQCFCCRHDCNSSWPTTVNRRPSHFKNYFPINFLHRTESCVSKHS